MRAAETGEESARTGDIAGGELLLKRTFAHAAVGLALVNMDGSFAYTNPAFAAITGYSATELKKMTIGRLMLPEDAAVNAKLKAKMLAGEIPGYVIEKRYRRKDGSLVWVKSSISFSTDDAGRPLHIVGLTENNDEQHKAEAALKDSEARFRFMAEHMPPKVFTALPDGTLDYLSPQWVAYTGLDFRAMNLRDWNQVVHPDDVEGNLKRWQHAVRTGEPFSYEHRLRRADGKYRWHLSSAHALRNADGNIAQWIGCATDIEELRRNRDLKTQLQVLATQREQLIATNRLKDEFIMLASHQLRTPASSVKQYVGMVLGGYAGKMTERQSDLLRQAYAGNERQLKIVDDLLKVARVDAGQVSLQKSRCDLAALIRDVIAGMHDTFAARRQSITLHCRRKQVLASVDAGLVRMVIENLLDNASKYSNMGKAISINVRQTNAQVIIAITDHGVGVGKRDQPKLFQKFSRINNPLSDAVGGTGLGLYWAKKITELHAGTLDATSKLRQGSTFTVALPK